MKIGLVCPYAFDVPGGVQFHIRDLAEYFSDHGHQVSVIAPVDDDSFPMPHYLVSCGRSVPVRYNGSVARLAFGPTTSSRVSRWLEDGEFDVVHLHEPLAPSATLLALWSSSEPVVATFHTATLRSRALHAANPILRPSTERIRARIAVSKEARDTVRRHLDAEAYIIPNGVWCERFTPTGSPTRFSGSATQPTIAFLGRIDERRKGLQVLSCAMPTIVEQIPGARLIVAGPGDVDEARATLPPAVRQATEFLGGVTEKDKIDLLRSADLYVAPHIGGESFGIVLVEAMAAGAPVLASDLPAFLDVLRDDAGGLVGQSFPIGNSEALAAQALELLRQPALRADLTRRGMARATAFDWHAVAERVLAVYETAIDGADRSPQWPMTGLLRRFTRSSTRMS